MDVGWFKICFATVGGILAAWFGTIWQLVAFAFIAMLMDYMTGLMAGRVNEGLNSKKAIAGLYKKFGLLSLLVLGFFLDGAFNHYIAHGFSFEMPFNLPIGLIVSMWIVITEAISICENVERLGVPVPPWLLSVLRKAHETVDKKDEEEKEDSLGV